MSGEVHDHVTDAMPGMLQKVEPYKAWEASKWRCQDGSLAGLRLHTAAMQGHSIA